ncbi:MAG: protease modulator HflK [Sphingomonas sp.]|jgi:membrane protease subunit HflK|uniref:protease modulator HflK n=1 Tax=Sphingomonas sp. TaxID=28214 RepID=UPI003562B503
MTTLPRWLQRFTILQSDNPKGPWGGGGPDKAGSGGGSGDGNDGGPRNPWSVPPQGRPRGAGPSALDEFLRRARGGGGGNGSGGGRPHLPGTPNARTLWMIGVGLIVLVWLVFTSFHAIGPQQRGVVTYLGRYAGTIEPGIRLTPPAPFASVTKVDVRKINTETFPADGGGGENLMLTADQNIVDLNYSVRWDISNPQDYAFQIAKPVETVRATAESAMRAVIATTALDDAIGSGRNAIELRVQDTMQQILDSYNAGIRIQGVAIKQAAPPSQVMDDFKSVSAAQQEAQGMTNQARGYAQQVLAHAQGEAAAFDKVYEQYKLAPDVTRRRMYYETMEAVLAKTDKTIVEGSGVVPYLPLSGTARRLPDAPAAAATTPAPVQGGGQ